MLWRSKASCCGWIKVIRSTPVSEFLCNRGFIINRRSRFSAIKTAPDNIRAIVFQSALVFQLVFSLGGMTGYCIQIRGQQHVAFDM